MIYLNKNTLGFLLQTICIQQLWVYLYFMMFDFLIVNKPDILLDSNVLLLPPIRFSETKSYNQLEHTTKHCPNSSRVNQLAITGHEYTNSNLL